MNTEYIWTDNPTISGVSICNTDILNECLMHLKYDNLGKSSFDLFDTKTSDHLIPFENSQGWALQGTYVYKEALAGSRYGYPDFYAQCLKERSECTESSVVTSNGTTATVYVHSNGHRYYDITEKATVDSVFEATGKAWWYGIDTENQRIFLPRNNFFEQLTTDPTKASTSVNAGLPNITGTLSSFGAWSSTGTGAISTTKGSGNFHKGGEEAYSYSMNFNASNSNDIYGNSSTVQPTAVKKLLYICVGNTTNYEGLTDIINQGTEILEQVNQGIESRVNLDATNLNSTGKSTLSLLVFLTSQINGKH